MKRQGINSRLFCSSHCSNIATSSLESNLDDGKRQTHRILIDVDRCGPTLQTYRGSTRHSCHLMSTSNQRRVACHVPRALASNSDLRRCNEGIEVAYSHELQTHNEGKVPQRNDLNTESALQNRKNFLPCALWHSRRRVYYCSTQTLSKNFPSVLVDSWYLLHWLCTREILQPMSL